MFGKRMGLSFLVISFLVHTPITEAALKMLSCRSIQPESGASFDALTEARREVLESANVTVPAVNAPESAWLAYNASVQAVKEWELYGEAPAAQGQLRLVMDLEYECSTNRLERLQIAFPMLGFSLLIPIMVYALV